MLMKLVKYNVKTLRYKEIDAIYFKSIDIFWFYFDKHKEKRSQFIFQMLSSFNNNSNIKAKIQTHSIEYNLYLSICYGICCLSLDIN